MKDPLITLCGYLLQRAASGALAELNQRLAPLGLRHAGVAMLMLVETHPGISQSHAGRILDIQRANMVPFVARLALGDAGASLDQHEQRHARVPQAERREPQIELGERA